MKRELPSRIIERAHAAGITHMTSNDAGEYTCHQCGHTWMRRDRWLWWPISFAWRRVSVPGSPVFSVWGWQVDWDGHAQRVFGRSVRIGRLVIKFGERRAP